MDHVVEQQNNVSFGQERSAGGQLLAATQINKKSEKSRSPQSSLDLNKDLISKVDSKQSISHNSDRPRSPKLMQTVPLPEDDE